MTNKDPDAELDQFLHRHGDHIQSSARRARKGGDVREGTRRTKSTVLKKAIRFAVKPTGRGNAKAWSTSELGILMREALPNRRILQDRSYSEEKGLLLEGIAGVY